MYTNIELYDIWVKMYFDDPPPPHEYSSKTKILEMIFLR